MATLLIIDDCEAQRAQIRRAVEPSRLFDRVLEAPDGIRGLKRLLDEPVDVVLCDLELPGLDGEKLLKVKEAAPSSQHVPFVFLTASQDLDRKIRLLEGGATDLVMKPFHPGELVARLRLHLKVKRLQDELREKNETLARLSTTDHLTGLRTRRYVTDVLAIEFLRARRYGTPLCVVMADLDHFKRVNDEHGHLAGDRVLHGVAALLREQLRATDVAGRYGGEEILVVLSHTEPAGAGILAERWRLATEETSFEGAEGGKVQVTLSLGIAAYTPGMQSADELVEAADAALYRAKDQGRNRVAGVELPDEV